MKFRKLMKKGRIAMIEGFVSTMSIEEKERIFDEAKALEAKGLIKESEQLMNTIPMIVSY